MTNFGNIGNNVNNPFGGKSKGKFGRARGGGPGGGGTTTNPETTSGLIDGKNKYCLTTDDISFSIMLQDLFDTDGALLEIASFGGISIKNLKECKSITEMPTCPKMPPTPPFVPMGKGDLRVWLDAKWGFGGEAKIENMVVVFDCIKCDDLSNPNDPISSIIEVGGDALIALFLNFLLQAFCQEGDYFFHLDYESKCLKDVTVPCVIESGSTVTNICLPTDTEITLYGAEHWFRTPQDEDEVGGVGGVSDETIIKRYERKYPGFDGRNLSFDEGTYSLEEQVVDRTDELCAAIAHLQDHPPTTKLAEKCISAGFGAQAKGASVDYLLGRVLKCLGI